MSKYVIAIDTNPISVQDSVNSYLKAGYVLHGNLSSTQVVYKRGWFSKEIKTFYFQALVSLDESP